MAFRSMAKPDIIVCEWTACLYDDTKRQWISGTLVIKADMIVFRPTDPRHAKKGVCLSYTDFIDVKKATTGLVFGAVYIVTRTKQKLWFSSLEDREGMYGTLHHFWRSQLMTDSDTVSKNNGQKTKMGQKLLGIVHDSEDTLSKAAVQLHQQGQQIDSARWTMADLHNDLDVAERLVDDLETWVGRWRLPQHYETSDPCVVNKSDIPEIFEFEILHAKLEMGKSNGRHLGLLRISQEGFMILTLKQKSVHNFRWSDVSKFRVITPYELLAIRHNIGKPDLTYSLVCANMVAILKLLSKCGAKYKLQFDTPPDTVVCTRHSDVGERPPKHQASGGTADPSTIQLHATSSIPQQPISLKYQIQMDQSQKIVSDSEAEQLSTALKGLKSLALSVQEEESIQNEKLDSLTGTVGRANDRLKTAEVKIKRHF